MAASIADKDGDFYTWMGLTLVAWQRVEDAHYLAFLKMVGAPKPEICSVLYFSPPSFESRRSMVDRVAEYALTAADNKEWAKISKRLAQGAAFRGRVAHYGVTYDFLGMQAGEAPKLGEPRLAPSYYDRVKDPRHDARSDNERIVTVKHMMEWTTRFHKLGSDVDSFTKAFSLPPPEAGLGLLSALLLAPPLPRGSNPSLSKSIPSGLPPTKK